MGTAQGDSLANNETREKHHRIFDPPWMALYTVYGQSDGQFSRKFSEIAVVMLKSLVAVGAGSFPRCKPDERNRAFRVFRVFFRSAWSHVLTKTIL